MRQLLFAALLLVFAVIMPLPVESASSAQQTCAVTAMTEEKPTNGNTATFSRYWFRSTDGKIFASASGRWFAGDNKILWERPADTQLKISGHLVDDPAVQLTPHIPDGYQSNYQSSGLMFPAPGCWQVKGEAGDSSLEFTIEVLPRFYYGSSRSCMDFTDAAGNTDVIIVGRVIASTPDRSGFAWLTVQAIKEIKGKVKDRTFNPEGYIDILHDTLSEVKPQRGKSYLFFLITEPGSAWQVLCEFSSLVEVVDDKIKGKVFDETIDTVAALEDRLKP